MKYLGMLALAALLALSPAFAGEPYLKAFGGAGIFNDFEATGDHASFVASPDVGYVGGVALGTSLDFLPGVGIELEASYRNATFAGPLIVCGTESEMTGDTGTFAAMFNTTYTFPLTPDINLTALAGAGYASRRITIVPTPDNWEINSSGADRSGFAYQVGAGADYALSDTMRVGVEYVMFQGPESGRTVIFDGKPAFYEADGDTHEARLTLRVAM